MWQRFTERARRVVFFAQEEAARLGENYVGTEHLLLGLVRENDSVAARILERLDVPLGRIRSDIERQVTRGHGNLGQDMQLTPRAKRVIDLAYEEARQLNNNYIGTEHLLLGLIREGDGLAARVLVKLGADLERTRREVYAMQEGEEATRQAATQVGAGSADDRARYFGDEAMQLLQFAQEEAALRNETCVGTEHLLLGLIRAPNSAAARALERLGVLPGHVRSRVEQQAIGSLGVSSETIPLTWHALRVIDLAHEAARQLHNDYVGAEHLLLALLHEGDSSAAHALREVGVTWDLVRSEARQLSSKAGESFNRRAGHFLDQARKEAEASRKGAVNTEHLLLSLIQEESAGARILEALGVSLEDLRAGLQRQIAPPEGEAESPSPDETARPLTPRALEVIDRARGEARRLRGGRIGSEHMLLGLTLDGAGFGAQVLKDAGVSPDRLLTVMMAGQAEDAAAPRATTTSEPGPQQPRRASPGEEVPPSSEQPPASGGPATASPERLERLAQQAKLAAMSPAGRRQGAVHAVAAARHTVARESRLTDFISINDLTPGQARALLTLAQTLKATGDSDRMAHREILPGRALAMIFEKPSLRTRVTFEVGMFQLGGHAVSLQPAEIQLGQRETVADAARNLERWVDGIMARTFSHQHVVELAQNACVPVINGLTDREHPCQALADFLTIREKKGRTEGLKLAFLGDGNNVAHSLLLLGAKLGTHVTVAGPEGYEPDAEIIRKAQEAGAAAGARIEVTRDPLEAVRDADIIYTDVWTSMGQEAQAEERAARFAPYQVNADLVKHARWDAIVMHDLPAHRGQEITDEVMDGPQAVMFDQAENRLHAQKALLAVLLE